MTWSNICFSSKTNFLLWLFQENQTHYTKYEPLAFWGKHQFLKFSFFSSSRHSRWSLKCLNSREPKHHGVDLIKCHLKWKCDLNTLSMCLEHMAYQAQTQIYLKWKIHHLSCNNLTHLMCLWLHLSNTYCISSMTIMHSENTESFNLILWLMHHSPYTIKKNS